MGTALRESSSAAREPQAREERGGSEKRTPAQSQRVVNSPLPLNEDDGGMNMFVMGDAQLGLRFGGRVQSTEARRGEPASRSSVHTQGSGRRQCSSGAQSIGE